MNLMDNINSSPKYSSYAYIAKLAKNILFDRTAWPWILD